MTERTFPKWDPERGYVGNGTTDAIEIKGGKIQYPESHPHKPVEKFPRPTHKECMEYAAESLHRMIKETFGV